MKNNKFCCLQVNSEGEVGEYLGNPVNSYLLLKRFNVEWRSVQDMLELDHAEQFTQVFHSFLALLLFIKGSETDLMERK